jgi:hypothetical protein
MPIPEGYFGRKAFPEINIHQSKFLCSHLHHVILLLLKFPPPFTDLVRSRVRE